MATKASPVAVTAREIPKKKPELFNEVEEGIEWTLEFSDGALAKGFTSYNDRANNFRADADRGWFELQSAYIYRNLRGETHKGPLKFEPEVNQQALQMDDFADCVMTGRATPVPGAMGRRDMCIVEAIYASAAAAGARVEIKA